MNNSFLFFRSFLFLETREAYNEFDDGACAQRLCASDEESFVYFYIAKLRIWPSERKPFEGSVLTLLRAIA